VIGSSVKFNPLLVKQLETVFYLSENRISINDDQIYQTVVKDLHSAYANFRVVSELKGLEGEIDLRAEYCNMLCNYPLDYQRKKANYMLKFKGKNIKKIVRG